MRECGRPVNDWAARCAWGSATGMCCDGGVTETTPIRRASVCRRAAGPEAADFVRRRRDEVFGAAQPTGRRSAVRAKSTPTDPVTIVDTETERLLRDRLAELRPGRPRSRRGGGRIDRRTRGPHVGARPDRRHGQLRLRDRGVRGVGGVQRRRLVGGRRGGERAYRGGLLRGARSRRPRRSATVPATPLRCSSAAELSMSLVGTGFSYAPEQRSAQAEILTGCCRSFVTCDGWAPVRWICAWWPRVGWTPTTRTASTSGTGRRVR